MKFLLSIALCIAFAYYLKDSIRKNSKYYYIAALAIALVVVFVDTSSLPSFCSSFMSTFFYYGTVSTAIFTLVMYANAFRNGSIVQKTLMPIRAELSIIACILAYAHNIYAGKTYFVMLFTDSGRMSTLTICACIITMILIALMTPLFITSFKPVRKKMKAKNWKKLQRLAYVFYMLIYVHIMCLMLPLALNGMTVYIIDVIVYSIVFLGYGTLRLNKYYKKTKKPIAIVLILAMYLALALAIALNFVDFSANDESGDTSILEETSKYDIDLSSIADGEYTGEGIGFNGIITVSVTIADGTIEKIKLVNHDEEEEYMSSATNIRSDIIKAQSIDVDAITGATYSSIGIKDAVLDALTN